jgi:hypothetical protein
VLYGLVVSYQDIIDAIDAAILEWAGKPVQVASPAGGTITYRSLTELTAARREYSRLAAQSAGTGGPVFGKITAGGK